MKPRSIKLLIFITLFNILGGVLFASIVPFNHDILSSLGRDYFDDEATEAYKKYETSLSQKVLILFQGQNQEKLYTQAFELKKYLSESMKAVDYDSNQKSFKDLYSFYFENRHLFLTKSQIDLIKNNRIELLEQRAKERMYSPFFTSGFKLKDDPLLLSEDFLAEKIPPFILSPYKELDKLEADLPTFVISGKIREGMESEVLDLLIKTKKDLQENSIYFTSLSFYSVFAKKQASYESTFFSVLSILMILTVFWFNFKSLRHLFFSLNAMGLCCLVGFSIATLVFGELFLMTILLGICVLGILVDYFIHYYVKEFSVKSGEEAFTLIKKPLVWSLSTTVVGLFLFLLAPLPILKQFSVFTCSTLIAAFLSVKYLFPLFFEPSHSLVERLPLNEKVLSLFSRRHVWWGVTLVFAATLFFITFVGDLTNNIRSYSSSPEVLSNSEIRIRDALELNSELRYLLVRGEDEQDLLRKNSLVGEKLNISNKLLLSDWIPPLSLQYVSMEAYSQVPGYQSIDKTPISLGGFLEIFPSLGLWDIYLGEIGEHFYSVIPLYGGDSPSEELIDNENIFYVDKVSQINSDIADFQRWIVKGGLLFVILFFMILLQKISLKSAVLIIFPSVFGVLTSLCLSQSILGSLNLFNLLGGILIFALGVDYSFFYYFNRADNLLTAKAIEISTLTTISSFGVMALSSTPAVEAFGLTVLLGIITTWLVVPLGFKDQKNV